MRHQVSQTKIQEIKLSKVMSFRYPHRVATCYRCGSTCSQGLHESHCFICGHIYYLEKSVL